MISLREKLMSMIKDLQTYKEDKRESIYMSYVQKRLDKSYSSYEKDLMQKYDSILSYDEDDILKYTCKEFNNGNKSN